MGKLLILCGPSGSGKTTILNALPLKPLITVTTRPKREGEIDGVHYHFLTPEEFERLDALGEIPEKTVYAGVRYGIFRKDIEAVLKGEDHAVVLDTIGIQFMRDYMGPQNVRAIYVGITLETMKKRLMDRGTSKEEIERRLYQALDKELTPEYRSVCDAEIWNEGSFEHTMKHVHELLVQWGFRLPQAMAV